MHCYKYKIENTTEPVSSATNVYTDMQLICYTPQPKMCDK